MATAVFTATTTTTTASSALFTRLGDVDRKGAAIQFLAIQAVNGFLGFFARTHGHKAKAAGAIGRAIHHQVCFGNGAKRGKRVLQVVFGDFEGKISHK